MATLAEIRAKLIAQQNKTENNRSGGNGDKAMYPFWNTPEGKSVFLRFLPDGNLDNTFFWEEKLVIKLPFQGIKGESDKETIVQIPCMDMYKPNSCPIIAETRSWWKNPDLEHLARIYYKKKSYIFQGFVIDSQFQEEQPPENPIRRFVINSSIFDIIKSILLNEDSEDSPTHYVAGRDFRLTKTKKGEHANYTTSQWNFKTRTLNNMEKSALDTYGLFNLKDFLPKQPTEEELEVIKEMFKASVDDQAYDPKRWGNYFKPYGYSSSNNNNSTQDTGYSQRKNNYNDDEVDESSHRYSTNSTESALNKPKTSSTSENQNSDNGNSRPDPMDILNRIKERKKSNS